jgi:hypothetical protein
MLATSAKGCRPAVHEEMKRPNAHVLKLEGEADRGGVIARPLPPVGDPSFDLEAPSVPKRRELGDPELCAERADRIQRGDGIGEHGADRMRVA